jgi:Protein of unknown function (DUF3987)
MSNPPSIIESYLQYTADSEVPATFSRWSILSTIGAYLGRQFYLKHGHFTIYPNMYVMLMGSPGTRKSTAIKTAKSILTKAGYTSIAAEKSTKEKFILDLAGAETDSFSSKPSDILDQNLWGGSASDSSEIFVMADEFNDFFGNNILDFVSFLGTLWDYSGTYRNRIKNGTSVEIPNPTVSILGGNTPTTFATTFPPEIFGQGFFSRILLIHGEPNGKRIAFPKPPNPDHTDFLVQSLQAIKLAATGSVSLASGAEKLLERIYRVDAPIPDQRFSTYFTRRFTHLLKLCLIVAASRNSTQVAERDVVYANTILHYAEQFMPRALGEFGRSKHSAVTDKVVSAIESLSISGPVPIPSIWPHVHMDLEGFPELSRIVQNLIQAGRVQWCGTGCLPNKSMVGDSPMTEYTDFSLLSTEEQRYVRISSPAQSESGRPHSGIATGGTESDEITIPSLHPSLRLDPSSRTSH